MSLLRTIALLVPAIRRLHDSRNALIARAEGRLIETEYPYHPHKRPIEEAAGGRRLIARLHAEEDRYAAALRGVARHVGSFLRIPRAEEDPRGPFWANDWFPPFDGASLYEGEIATVAVAGRPLCAAPRRAVESGHSSYNVSAETGLQGLGGAAAIDTEED